MTKTYFVAALALLTLLACSSKKEKKAKPTTQAVPPAATDSAAPTGLPPGPYKIERTQLQTLARKSVQGDTHEWKAMEGIEVTNESMKQLYVSRGSFFVSFKADVKAGKDNCVLRWKTDLIAGKTGRGESVATITGAQALVAGDTVTVSGIVALSSKDASKIQSASAGYWTLCGDNLPSPSEHDFAILKTDIEEVAMGNAIKIHLSVMKIERLPKKDEVATRCHFNAVAEDIDNAGYTLNRDFASYSLAPNSQGQIKLRRTAFEGGSEVDYVNEVIGKRYYIGDVSCDPVWDPKSAKVEGLTISDLEMHRYEPPAPGAEELARATFDHSLSLSNKTGKDCSFRVRYHILDEKGFAMHKSPVLSEVLHLGKGDTASYRADKHRLYTWLDQAEAPLTLVVQEAAPLEACGLFDPQRALAK